MAVGTLLTSWIAGGIYNLDSQRFRKSSLDTREEGWTESWGNQQDGSSGDGNGKPTRERNMEIDDETISQLLSTPYPQTEILLTQHRPAWFEQMLMRVAGLPHIVLNSSFISFEATGQLPNLRDCIPSKPPVLVGRNHPTNLQEKDNIINNSILSYLRSDRGVDLDEKAGVTTDQQRGSSRCFQYMIHMELTKILLHLRFDDSDSWDQVYRDQYIVASTIEGDNKNGLVSVYKKSWFIRILGRFQASMERNVERKRLLGYGRSGQKTNVSLLLDRANAAYYAIDRQLCFIEEQNKANSQKYMLGTDIPALVDVLLWAHLAEALCDVHLIVLLASYPRLINYFQDMYRSYFCSNEEKSAEERAWKDWNVQQNLSNSFMTIPILSESVKDPCGMIKDAVDLMQKSSLQKQNLQEVLETVKVMRAEEQKPKPRESMSFLLYRWCMGETSNKEGKKAEKAQDNSMREKLLRDQARNDQTWISGILVVSAVAVILIKNRPR